MDSAVFGSFSQTSFIDLYHANRSSWHDSCVLLEIFSDKDFNRIVVGEENTSQIITTANNIEDFHRKTYDSYLFGITYDSTSPHAIYALTNGIIDFTESFKERKKKHEYHINIEDGVLTFYTTDKEHLYLDQYMSLSSIPLNNFDVVVPNVEYSLDVDEVCWTSFGAMEGYGSRNKIKKLMYSQYSKDTK